MLFHWYVDQPSLLTYQLMKVCPAVLYAVMIWPGVSPLKSTHHIISRRHPMTSSIWGKTGFEGCFNVLPFMWLIWRQKFIYGWFSEALFKGWEDYIIYKTHAFNMYYLLFINHVRPNKEPLRTLF